MVNFIGLDLGQSNDYTGLSLLKDVIDKARGRIYHLRRLERVRGASYPDIVDKVAALMQSPALEGSTALIVDQTGVGAPVVDLLRKAGLKPVAVFIHGGDAVTHEGLNYRVPKRDLAGVVKVLLQNNRMEVSDQLKLSSVLQQELLNFNYKLNPLTAHDSYGCWREGLHDDLVLAVALAAWWAEVGMPKPMIPLVVPRAEPITPGWKLSSYGSYFPHAPPH